MDLSTLGNLLSLMSARVRQHPNIFAWADSLTIPMALNAKAVDCPETYAMILTDRTARSSYGELLPWAHDNQAAWNAKMLRENLLELNLQCWK